MLMRRFGSTPSHRFKLKLHTAPAGGRLENSWKFTQGIDTSRLQPRSLSVLSFSGDIRGRNGALPLRDHHTPEHEETKWPS